MITAAQVTTSLDIPSVLVLNRYSNTCLLVGLSVAWIKKLINALRESPGLVRACCAAFQQMSE